MTDLVTLITQNGIGVVCVGFMIVFISTTMKDNNKVLDEIQKTLVAIQTTLQNLSGRVDTIEHEVNKKKKKDTEVEE